MFHITGIPEKITNQLTHITELKHSHIFYYLLSFSLFESYYICYYSALYNALMLLVYVLRLLVYHYGKGKETRQQEQPRTK